MPETKLKPCPFCGSTKLKIDNKCKLIHYKHTVYCTTSVRCSCCHARGGTTSGEVPCDLVPPTTADKLTDYKALEENAVKAWNRRAYHD